MRAGARGVDAAPAAVVQRQPAPRGGAQPPIPNPTPAPFIALRPTPSTQRRTLHRPCSTHVISPRSTATDSGCCVAEQVTIPADSDMMRADGSGLQARYAAKMSKHELAFVMALLEMDPSQRPSTQQALALPWLAEQ